MLLAIFALVLQTGTTTAQEGARNQSYWQFAASGRLDSVVTADINGDGVDEFLVLDEKGQLTVLLADGQQFWTHASADPITAMGTLHAQDGRLDVQLVVLAGRDYLMLLDTDGSEVWRIPLAAATAPVAIHSFDHQSNGSEDILLLLASGQLLIYNAAGEQIWQFAGQENLSMVVNPFMLVSDFDGDGNDEIVLGVFTPRRFSELIFLKDGIIQWQQAISRRITGLARAPFGPAGNYIAVGTNFGQLDIYSPTGVLTWYRTLNRPITSLAPIELPDQPALAVGTAAGSVVAFSGQGQRLWTNNLDRDAGRSVLALLPVRGRAEVGQTPLAAILESISPTSAMADVMLLGNNGQTLAKLNDTDLPELTRLVDVNGDGHHEVLLARFATLQLTGLGVGNSEYNEEWEYVLDAEPTAMLVLDLDGDEEEEVIVGTRDGRLHSLSVDRAIRWLNAPGEVIAFLDSVRGASSDSPQVVVVRHQRPPVEVASEEAAAISWLELREATGEREWEVVIPESVTTLTIDDRAEGNNATILLGTLTGQLIAFDLAGNQLWALIAPELSAGIQQIHVVNEGGGDDAHLLVASGQDILRVVRSDDGNFDTTLYARFIAPIKRMFPVNQPGGIELSVSLVAFTTDGFAHGLNQFGDEMGQWSWPFALYGLPGAIMPAAADATEAFQENITAFLVADGDGQLSQITIAENQPQTAWTLDNLGIVQAVSWQDLDRDGRPDTGAFGSRDGSVRIYEQLHTRNPRSVLTLPLGSITFDLALLKRTSRQTPDLLAITQNGFVRLFREEENRPPLLTQPQIDADQGQYSIGIQVNDVENDTVAVQLELYDVTTGVWQPLSEQRLETGNGPLFWPVVEPLEGSTRVDYRFRFSDGFYRGYISPPPGPAVEPVPPGPETTTVMFASLSLLIVAGVVLYVRQSRMPASHADRFFNRLNKSPRQTLPLLEEKYASLGGSPDFLLQLANRARNAGNTNLANLSDGLFLLANRPQAGLPIITRTLEDVAASHEDWEKLAQRKLIYRTCQAMLEAPSITELGLLRPQFVHMLALLSERGESSPILESLLPVVTNMRDSERVDAADDRLVYLNQATVRLRLVQEQLAGSPPSVERTLVRSLTRRWAGLLTAEIEEQRGRAELEVSLKTKRLAPNGQTHVAMEIRNTGRAAAENIVAVLNENPAYLVRSEPQNIPFLPSGHSRQIRFLIEPQAEERFRVGLSITYDDRNRHDKTAAFGDMVHLLTPVREFAPIANPYLPGTPLRKDNPLFYGREELFDFIAEHADTQSQRNVFMLVGQRRTGKTSLLLRLEDYLPPHLLPVYIDCQSLGVSPGMPALLQELAWHIADVLGARGLDIEVPELRAWQEDPTRLFQREFLPAARRLLPQNTTLLMVFDEFEAFESMVADGILPRTFFPYMRHLIQHSTGLGFVFVGTRRLEEMSADYWSVLFNIALYRKIDFLNPEAAERLICEPVAPFLVYDDLAIDKILRVTAGHPYFLQLVCYTLVKQANQQKTGYVTISDVNVALDEMLRLGEVHFAYLWQRSNATERAVLAAAAHLMDRGEPLHPEELIDYLQTYGIELGPTEVTHALNTLVEQDVMQELTVEGKALYELRIGLVGQWVVQNKSLSKLHVHLES